LLYADERIFPFDGEKGPRKTLLDVPEDGPPQIYVVFDQPRMAIPRPASFVAVPGDAVVGGIEVGAEIPLDEVSCFVGSEAEQDVELVGIVRVKMDRMGGSMTRP